MAKSNEPNPAAAPGQAGPQGQQGQQVRVQLDEREMSTSYANAFRTNATSEEVIVDFGLNFIVPANQQSGQGGQGAQGGAGRNQLMLKFNDRIILNYKTAKRLAITLGQLVRSHEERFGEIQLEQGSNE
ncbi:MAG: DUF3467 domain-containing protein [Phycisphaeraceae bacterium]